MWRDAVNINHASVFSGPSNESLPRHRPLSFGGSRSMVGSVNSWGARYFSCRMIDRTSIDQRLRISPLPCVKGIHIEPARRVRWNDRTPNLEISQGFKVCGSGWSLRTLAHGFDTNLPWVGGHKLPKAHDCPAPNERARQIACRIGPADGERHGPWPGV